jgi:hypothetical protein
MSTTWNPTAAFCAAAVAARTGLPLFCAVLAESPETPTGLTRTKDDVVDDAHWNPDVVELLLTLLNP